MSDSIPNHRRRRHRQLHPPIGAFCALATVGLLNTSAARATPFTITAPIRVPLYWTPISSGYSTTPQKLGIYAALGGSNVPQLFEFDTGGAGFYAASASTVPWWGSGVVQNSPYTTFSQSYDSGNSYAGTVVTTSVGLFASASATAPLFTATDVTVGQTTQITNNQGSATWTSASTGSTPAPLLDAFWGDFGMALKQGRQGVNSSGASGGPTLDSLVSQLVFGSGVTSGYRVHASSQSPWVQFGLGAEDLVALSTTFALNAAGLSSATGVPYYDPKVINGALQVNLGTTAFVNPQTGIIFDTGAFTTIHQSGVTSTPPTTLPTDLIATSSSYPNNFIQPGADVLVSGQTAGLTTSIAFLSFPAGIFVDQDLVGIQSDGSYYLNTGILPFLSNDIVFNLQDAQLSVIPQSVPAPLGPWGVVVAAGLTRRLRRQLRGAVGGGGGSGDGGCCAKP